MIWDHVKSMLSGSLVAGCINSPNNARCNFDNFTLAGLQSSCTMGAINLPTTEVYATYNEAVELECQLESSALLTNITSVVWWKWQPGSNKFVMVGRSSGLEDDYRNRASISSIGGHLNIRHVTFQDEGCYKCVDSGILKGVFYLHVIGE